MASVQTNCRAGAGAGQLLGRLLPDLRAVVASTASSRWYDNGKIVGVPVGRVWQPVDAPAGWSRDLYDEEVERFHVPIVERGDRVLWMAGNVTSDPWQVVSAFFDRSMRGEL